MDTVQNHTTAIIPAEVIPSTSLPRLNEALVTLETETARLEPLRIRAEAMVVDTPEKCSEAKQLMLEIRSLKKAAGFNLDSYWEIAKRVTDFLKAKYSAHEDKADAIDNGLKAKVKEFERKEREAAEREAARRKQEEERIAREKAEQQRKERELQAKEEREKRVKAIKAQLKSGEIGKREATRLLKEAGALEEEAVLQAELDSEAQIKAAQNAPAPTVKANIPTVAGVPSRTNYKAEVTNASALLAAYVEALAKKNTERALYLRQFITVNEQELGAEARRVKDSKKLSALIPGVRFYED